jgi:hypothetical protein
MTVLLGGAPSSARRGLHRGLSSDLPCPFQVCGEAREPAETILVSGPCLRAGRGSGAGLFTDRVPCPRPRGQPPLPELL